MAASSRPTGVHYALVVFILISIVFFVSWLVVWRGSNGSSDMRRDLDAAKKKSQEDESNVRARLAEIALLKELIGSKFPDVGDGTNPNSVTGDIKAHINTYGQGVSDPTLHGTIEKLYQLIVNTSQARDKLQEEKAIEIAQFEQAKNELNAALAQEKTSRDKSDKDRVAADSQHKEELDRKEADIAMQKKALTELQAEYDEYRESAEKQIASLKTRVNNLQVINVKVTSELDEAKRVSFEDPDGYVQMVDPFAKMVWISLGEADGLKPRTTFSVYKKINHGVGRGTKKGTIGAEDIKGSIEVTRIMGPHQSEARILNEDQFNPMSKGDPIYSPIWSSGRGEVFSVVGIIDLDGDGKDDPDLFKELLATSSASIDNRVDQKGVLWVNGKEEDDPKITERTKFLVIGKIPEIADTADPEEIQNIQKILSYRKKLEDAARERGVRVVSLGDFLNYMGYKPQRRLFVPGGDVPWNLKSGSQSGSVNEAGSASSRRSSGNTSKLYSTEKSQSSKNYGSGSGSGMSGKVFRGGSK